MSVGQERTGANAKSGKPAKNSRRRPIGPRYGAHRSKPAQSAAATAPVGLLPRELAVDLVTAVLHQGHALDEAIARGFASARYADLEARDRALARQIAATTLRYARPLQALLDQRLDKPLHQRYARVSAILLSAAAQLCRMATPPHAAISLAVEQTRLARGARHLDKLVNAVLRGLVRDAVSLSDEPATVRSAFPGWMWRRWVQNFGEDTAQAIAAASLNEAALDLTVKSDPLVWAERLGGVALATGTVRLVAGGRIDDLEGFATGAWWVQDAAAALPARLLNVPADSAIEIADLCAAPGGKTTLLAANGARVTAVDVSADRLSRLSSNLERLGLSAELIEADVATWSPGRQFDAVLLDAPCTATGTIRRHPDIPHLKREGDIVGLADLQAKLLSNAARLVRPGGQLVYCTCSLEPEEGEAQVAAFLEEHREFEVSAIKAGESGVEAHWITSEGYVRTLPGFTPALMQNSPALRDTAGVPQGMDGFFIARLQRSRNPE